jgi:hypothetical protein
MAEAVDDAPSFCLFCRPNIEPASFLSTSGALQQQNIAACVLRRKVTNKRQKAASWDQA